MGERNPAQLQTAVPEAKLNWKSFRLGMTVWIAVAILLRLYGSTGGDASVVGGLLFLTWTAPFGLIWQFWVAEPLGIRASEMFNLLGDVITIATGAWFWFRALPMLRQRYASSRKGASK